jgi:hypothetical protein
MQQTVRGSRPVTVPAGARGNAVQAPSSTDVM